MAKTRVRSAQLYIDSDWSINETRITNVAPPINPMDVVNKQYIDNNIVQMVTREIPSGAMNGTNTIFTLANLPAPYTEQVFLNGILQRPGTGMDYAIVGAIITFANPPAAVDIVMVTYIMGATIGGSSVNPNSVILKNYAGGSAVKGKALYFSSVAADTLVLADRGSIDTAAVGFSSGLLGEIVVSGIIDGFTGLIPNKWYTLGTSGGITLDYGGAGTVVQRVLYSISPTMGIVQIGVPVI